MHAIKNRNQSQYREGEHFNTNVIHISARKTISDKLEHRNADSQQIYYHKVAIYCLTLPASTSNYCIIGLRGRNTIKWLSNDVYIGPHDTN